MPTEADDPISQARQGTNWLVGLSGGAIGGALAKLDWILKFPTCGKILFCFAALFFFVSILFGVFYSFQLFALKQRKQKLDEAKARQASAEELKAPQGDLKSANEKVERFHNFTMGSFALAGLATISCLVCVLLFPNPEPPPTPQPAAVIPNHFTLTNVPVQAHGRLLHSHTFLLDEQTGDLWLMVCRPDKTVEFKRVQQLNLDGTPASPALPSGPKSTPPTK
jgi:hypothetical protein